MAIGAAKPDLVEQPKIENQPIFMLKTIQVSEYESLLQSLLEVYRLEADKF